MITTIHNTTTNHQVIEAVTKLPHYFKYGFLNGKEGDKRRLAEEIELLILKKLETDKIVYPRDIARELGVSISYVIEIGNKLIEEGKIGTQRNER